LFSALLHVSKKIQAEIGLTIASAAVSSAVATITSAASSTTASAAPTVTTAPATAAMTAAVSTTTPSTTRAAAFTLRASFVNYQCATQKIFAIEGCDCFLGFRIVTNLREAESARLTRETIAQQS
jgi:hypothetical protein